MPSPASSTSIAPLPAGTRPSWVHRTRSPVAYWLPAVSVLAMALVLVLLWPHNRRRGAHARSMPEAAASYVLLEGSYLVLPGNPLGNPWPGPGGGSLPEREDVTTRRLPAAEYTGLGIMSPWAPVPPGVPSNTLPNLAVRPVANVLTGLPPETIGITVACSAGLQRSGFRFEVPPGVETGLPAVVRFQVELDDKGDVIHLLADPGDNPASARILETAVSRGHGTRAGRGEVQVSWGK